MMFKYVSQIVDCHICTNKLIEFKIENKLFSHKKKKIIIIMTKAKSTNECFKLKRNEREVVCID